MPKNGKFRPGKAKRVQKTRMHPIAATIHVHVSLGSHVCLPDSTRAACTYHDDMGYGGHLRVLGGDWIGWLRFNALLLRAPLPGLLRFWAGQWDVTCATYRTEGEGWKASEDIVEDMKEEQDMQAYQDGEAEASEEIAATRTESDDEREAWAKAVAKAKAKAWQRWYREAEQSRSASRREGNSSISVVVPAVENVPSAAAAAFKCTRAQERNIIKYHVMRLWQRSISKTRDGGGEDAQ